MRGWRHFFVALRKIFGIFPNEFFYGPIIAEGGILSCIFSCLGSKIEGQFILWRVLNNEDQALFGIYAGTADVVF